MEFNNNAPKWNAKGVEPPDEMKDSGFQSGYKPPAPYFNWFWNRVSLCLSELISKLKSHADDTDNPHDTTPEKIGAAKEQHSHNFVKGVLTTGESDYNYYDVTLEGIKRSEVAEGFSLTIVPHKTSNSSFTPSLRVFVGTNSAAVVAADIRRRLSGSTTATVPMDSNDWLKEGEPVTVTYDGTYWIADMPKPNAPDIYGILPVSKGGTGKATVTKGNYLVGDGTGRLVEKTPSMVCTNIGAIPEILVKGTHYGDTLPDPGERGRIFFKKVSS